MPIIEERGSHLGQGQLRDSIMGPQYFQDSSNEPQQVNHPAVSALKHKTPEIRSSNNPIFINELPCSHSQQQQIPNQNIQYVPSGGDPNNPDDPDDDRPPSKGPPETAHKEEDCQEDHLETPTLGDLECQEDPMAPQEYHQVKDHQEEDHLEEDPRRQPAQTTARKCSWCQQQFQIQEKD